MCRCSWAAVPAPLCTDREATAHPLDNRGSCEAAFIVEGQPVSANCMRCVFVAEEAQATAVGLVAERTEQQGPPLEAGGPEGADSAGEQQRCKPHRGFVRRSNHDRAALQHHRRVYSFARKERRGARCSFGPLRSENQANR